MDILLKAVRTRLTSDATLINIVAADDIISSYNAEYTNYPCISLGIEAGGSFSEISGVTRTTMVIDVYSRTNKQELWVIYDRIKTLLHNQERYITNVSRVVHLIHEVKVDDNQYDLARNVWHLSAQYEILYSITGLSITTGANGAVYADETSVSAISEKEIAKFRGQVSLDISFESEMHSGQDRFGETLYYHTGIARLTFEEMMFKPSSLNLLWDINANSSGTLNDGSTSATIYQVSQSSYPSYLQVLFQMTKTDDGRRLEIEADRAVCQSLNIPFSKSDLSVINCEWILLGDSSRSVVKVAVEN